MRILVFEFITGGGYAQQTIPDALLQEARLMRDALLDDLAELTDLDILLVHDARLAKVDVSVQYLTVYAESDLAALLNTEQANYDIVWLIAPETEGILAFWCEFFSQQGKQLASSAQQAVAICQDKLATVELLKRAGVPCVATQLFDSCIAINTDSVVKINDSVGCDEVYFLTSIEQAVLSKLNPEKDYILQPYITGKTLSLSCLFVHGLAYFICCNEQVMTLENQQFELLACVVNIQPENSATYQRICQQIATAIPSLFGYVGIDLMQSTSGELLILEINPRLTSSYAGIKPALGLNIAELVLAMLKQQTPVLIKSKNKPVTIRIKQEAYAE